MTIPAVIHIQEEAQENGEPAVKFLFEGTFKEPTNCCNNTSQIHRAMITPTTTCAPSTRRLRSRRRRRRHGSLPCLQIDSAWRNTNDLDATSSSHRMPSMPRRKPDDDTASSDELSSFVAFNSGSSPTISTTKKPSYKMASGTRIPRNDSELSNLTSPPRKPQRRGSIGAGVGARTA